MEEQNNRKKTLILLIFIMLSAFSSIMYYYEIKDMRENWIYTTATIESRDLYSTSGEEYKYKYGIVYKIDGKEYHSYIISTYGSVFDIDYKIRVYVNPKNMQTVKYERWKTFK